MVFLRPLKWNRGVSPQGKLLGMVERFMSWDELCQETVLPKVLWRTDVSIGVTKGENEVSPNKMD